MSFKVDGISNSVSSKNVSVLENKLQEVEDEQGIFGKFWNGAKELTGIGTSQEKCEDMLEKYENGEVTFDEAIDYINSFESKQKSASELIKNIATGTAAIGFTVATAGVGPIGWATALAAAPIGAGVKTGLGAIDRATNEVEDDVLDAKAIAKDAISGAVTGVTSAVSSGVGAGIAEKNILKSVKNGTMCGLECGAIAGATSYLTDAALDEDVKFNFLDLTKNTLTSSVVSGVVGAGVGAGMYGIASIKGNVGASSTPMLEGATTGDIIEAELVEDATGQMKIVPNLLTKEMKRTIIKDSTASATRKFLGREVKNGTSRIASAVA